MKKYQMIIFICLFYITQTSAVTVKEYSFEKLALDSPLIVRTKCSKIYFITEAGIEKKVYTFTIQEIIKGTHEKKSIEVKTLKTAEKLQLIPSIAIGDEAVIFFTETLKIKGLKQGYLKLTKDSKTNKMHASYRDKTYTYETLKEEITKFIK